MCQINLVDANSLKMRVPKDGYIQQSVALICGVTSIGVYTITNLISFSDVSYDWVFWLADTTQYFLFPLWAFFFLFGYYKVCYRLECGANVGIISDKSTKILISAFFVLIFTLIPFICGFRVKVDTELDPKDAFGTNVVSFYINMSTAIALILLCMQLRLNRKNSLTELLTILLLFFLAVAQFCVGSVSTFVYIDVNPLLRGFGYFIIFYEWFSDNTMPENELS